MRQVLVLAAGEGRRLGPATAECPKAVIDVAGEPLVARTLRFARLVGCDRRIAVGGYLVERLRACVHEFDPEATVLENRMFSRGNVLTLRVGFQALETGGFLLMNADHIYNDGIAEIVRSVMDEAAEVTAFVDFDRSLGADDMKVELDEEHVVRMAKTLERWDAGYVGMTFVPAGRRAAYVEALDRAVERHGESVNVEQLLNDLSSDGVAPAIADISGVGWWEVDDASDREAAEAALRVRSG